MAGTVTVALTWHGPAVAGRLRSKVAGALNATAQDAVAVAQSVAPRDTGFMANTIEVVDEANSGKLEVTWGNITADYTLWQEIGARGRSGRFFLKQGADRAYPGLERRLKDAI